MKETNMSNNRGRRRGRTLLTLIMAAAVSFSGCASARKARPVEEAVKSGFEQKGKASWYGPGFHGRKTANGERFNMHELTAAHKSLPFDTLVEVTNEETGQSVVVRINDRGPFVRGRIIDLSKAAAKEIGLSGVCPVRISGLEKRPAERRHLH